MSNNHTAEIFSRIAPVFDRVGPNFFAQSGRRLVERMNIPAGGLVLDVACGRGAVLFPVAEKVGAQSQVFGVDLAEGMLRHTLFDLRQSGPGNIHLCQMDALQLAFDSQAFDFVLSSHSIIFFPQALGEFRRVLKPGGKTGLSIIASGCFDWLLDIFSRHTPPDEPDDTSETEHLALDTPAGLESALREAGFAEIHTYTEISDMLYPDEETWWQMLWTLGFRGALESMPPGAQSHFKADLFQGLQRFKGPDGFHIPFYTLFAEGAT